MITDSLSDCVTVVMELRRRLKRAVLRAERAEGLLRRFVEEIENEVFPLTIPPMLFCPKLMALLEEAKALLEEVDAQG